MDFEFFLPRIEVTSISHIISTLASLHLIPTILHIATKVSSTTAKVSARKISNFYSLSWLLSVSTRLRLRTELESHNEIKVCARVGRVRRRTEEKQQKPLTLYGIGLINQIMDFTWLSLPHFHFHHLHLRCSILTLLPVATHSSRPQL